jgi:hypothetical protein
MDEETKKIISEQMEKLPKVVQDIITNSGWQKKIDSISKKYSLHIDQEGDLQTETFLVMLGLENSDDFQKNLTQNLGLSSLVSVQVTQEINELIFKPIRTELQKEDESQPEGEKELKKEDILNEIENPITSIQPLTNVAPLAVQVSTNMPEPETPKPTAAPTVTPVSTTEITKQTPTEIQISNTEPKAQNLPHGWPDPSTRPAPVTTTSLATEKLTQVVKMPTEEKKAETPMQTPSTKLKIDPYREPIN